MKTTVYNSLKPTVTGLLIGLLIGVTLGPNHAHAQSRKLLDRMPSNDWSIEVQVGGGIPFKPKKPADLKPAYTLPSFQIGARYMITPILGIRPNFSYHHFQNGNDDTTVEIPHIGLDGVWSLSSYLPERRVRNRHWNFLVHAGIGGWNSTIENKTTGVKSNDIMFSAKAGGTAQLRLSSRAALTADLNVHFSSLQNFTYHGAKANIGGSDWERLFSPNMFSTLSFGLHYYLGNRRSHVDWR